MRSLLVRLSLLATLATGARSLRRISATVATLRGKGVSWSTPCWYCMNASFLCSSWVTSNLRRSRGRTVLLGVGGAVGRVRWGGGVHKSKSSKSPCSMYEIGLPCSSTLRRSSLNLNSLGRPSRVVVEAPPGDGVFGRLTVWSAPAPAFGGVFDDILAGVLPLAAGASDGGVTAAFFTGDLASLAAGAAAPGEGLLGFFAGDLDVPFLGVLAAPAGEALGLLGEPAGAFLVDFAGDAAFAAGFPLAGEAGALAGDLAGILAAGVSAVALDGVLLLAVDF